MNYITINPNYNKAINYATIIDLLGFSHKALTDKRESLKKYYKDGQSIIGEIDFLEDLLKINKRQIKTTFDKVKNIFESIQFDYNIISYYDDSYPILLRQTKKPPLFLFSQGDISLLSLPCISIVGARQASEKGKILAFKLAAILKNQAYIVASGLARGIDTAAHTGTIRSGGKTIAVIGTSLNKQYPSENKQLQEIIAENHLLISQFPFNHPITKANFPTRNYTMSGICLATIIVEAGETSGSLIQARHCFSQKRKLFILKHLLEREDLEWPKKYVKLGAIVIKEIDEINAWLKELRILHQNITSNKQQEFFK
ncbi:DNA-processing protein DprA [Candidatus Margulisiibacteriota bacterium]